MIPDKTKDLSQIPSLPHISGKTLFKDDQKAKEWVTLLHQRQAALMHLISTTQASMYAKAGNEDAEEFIIVSPCTDGIYKYQLTKFDKYGPVYDVRRNEEKEIIKAIPNSYNVIDVAR